MSQLILSMGYISITAYPLELPQPQQFSSAIESLLQDMDGVCVISMTYC